jgi:hypothetical protein
MGGALHVTDSDGDLNLFNVEHNDNGLWLNTNYGDPDNFWNPDNRFVFVRRNSLCFPVEMAGFFYLNWRLQPPIILPISFKLSERVMYFLLSRDFISQAICRKNFKISSLLQAFRR